MISNDSELMQYILDDVQKYSGFRHFKKASVLERLIVRKRPPRMLHPNPEDEFSIKSVGPHFGIINEYVSRYSSFQKDNDMQLKEPLVIEKMTRDGYMILNGHHRWAAALKMGLNALPVKIVNLTHEEDHKRMIENSHNVKRVIFDFDEILCTTAEHPRAEETPRLLFSIFEKVFQERLRWGAPALIQELQRQGFDVWVFTNQYHSLDYMESFFKAYKLKMDGIINGAGRKKSKKLEQEYREMVEKKYKLIYNVIHDGIVRIEPANKTFESYDLEASDSEWANKVMKIISESQGEV